MTYIVMAYIGMAYIAMALLCLGNGVLGGVHARWREAKSLKKQKVVESVPETLWSGETLWFVFEALLRVSASRRRSIRHISYGILVMAY